jgi:hypothetical protein
MIKLKLYNYLKSEFYFSRIIILQLIIIFGWWRLWRISPEFIHISTFDILNELPYFIYIVPYLFLLVTGFLFLTTKKNLYLLLYSLALCFSMILDVSTYHHGEFTLVVVVLHHLLNTKFQLNEKHLIAGLYLLCIIPKINYEFISGQITDNLLLNLNANLSLGYIGGIGTILFESCAVLLFLFPSNKYLSKFIIPLILFHFFMGLALGRGVLFNFIFIVMIAKHFSKFKLIDNIYFISASLIMILKILYFKFF